MKLYHDKRQDYFSSTRTDILDLMPNFSKRVLEIGCGSGQTLEMLKKEKQCTETVGIELFPEAAERLRRKLTSSIVWMLKKIQCRKISVHLISSYFSMF